MIYYTNYYSILGKMILVSDGEKLTGLFYDEKDTYKNILNTDNTRKDLKVFQKTKKWLDIYFQGKEPDFKIPISYECSEFQEQIYKILEDIPYGKLITYGEIAKIIARKRNIKTMSSQAVGTALAKNPIAIILPCHRVLAKNKFIGGYAGGIDRKIKLLEYEGVNLGEIKTKK